MRSLVQTDLLTRYRLFRQGPPTVAGLVKQNAKVLGGWSAALVFAAVLLWWLELHLVAAGVIGFVASTLFHAFTNYHRTAYVWPVIEQITDWQVVDRLGRERSQP